jgi:integrase
MARGLTALKVENAKAGDQRKEIADPGKPGLYLVIQPSGKKSWAVRYRRQADKEPRKYTIDGFPSLAVARKLAQDVLDKVAEGEDPAAAKQMEKLKKRLEPGESDGFSDVAIRFIKRDQRPNNRTWRETARLLGIRETEEGELEAIDGGLVDKWDNRKVSEITKRDVLDVVDAIDERGAGVMANRTLAAVRRLFNWCVEKDILSSSPCAGLKPPAEESSRRRVLSDEEIRWFWNACEQLKYPFGHAGKLLLLTGARRSEVTDMTRGEVKGDTWTIPRERSKNDEPHIVPLSEAALDVIKDARNIKSEKGFVFTTTGDSPVSGWSKAKNQIDALMLAAAKEESPKAKIEEWRLHDLRRTVASGMARLGIALEVIEKCLNHVSGSFAGIVGVYQLHSFEEEKRDALQKWAAHVEKIVAGKKDERARRRA